YDALLRLTEGAAPLRARHVPHVLYHRRRGSPSRSSAASREAHFERRGIAARVEALGPPGHYRVRYALPAELPVVSVIVPTRDRVELLRRCVDGVLKGTSYRALELLVVDNQSADPETVRWFGSLESDPRVRVLDYDAPFDFAALNNWAVRRANGDLLAFLNNDTEVIHPDWLDEMVSQALRPEIGAVGAKLLYPDDTIQHGGVILGIGGVAGHAHRGLRRNGEGYHGRAALAQNFSAVTAACLVVRREVFDEVGGFDPERFGVAFNDVDLCLRIRERGYRILWTPFAELYHHESASLGLPGAPARRERFEKESRRLVERWRSLIENDPAYNPNLT
ncbi:MAG: glycosyltransferase family 2 protein, partial [Vicinamibacteria bacterium]